MAAAERAAQSGILSDTAGAALGRGARPRRTLGAAVAGGAHHGGPQPVEIASARRQMGSAAGCLRIRHGAALWTRLARSPALRHPGRLATGQRVLSGGN